MGVLCDLTMDYRWNNIFHVMHKARKCSFKGRDWWSPDVRAGGEAAEMWGVTPADVTHWRESLNPSPPEVGQLFSTTYGALKTNEVKMDLVRTSEAV